ncbi:hypothetical protein DPEC_G00304370 [Dallia pectoralis]|uniref:Uncharacterized protein n=1 Tax=Dallia pectoralis TaxID=75939 RepID=A0ACC2FDI7_DALPE|nr:hypothetical protein DPEC_G00304370 [Dallia pectoralis]
MLDMCGAYQRNTIPTVSAALDKQGCQRLGSRSPVFLGSRSHLGVETPCGDPCHLGLSLSRPPLIWLAAVAACGRCRFPADSLCHSSSSRSQNLI